MKTRLWFPVVALAGLGFGWAAEPVRAQDAPKAAEKAKAKVKAKAKSTAKATDSDAPGKPLDLNTASEDELVENLPGVGPVTAKKIIAGRPYKAVADLEKAGISPRIVEAIKDKVTITAPKPAEARKAMPSEKAKVAEKTKAKAKTKTKTAEPKAATADIEPVNINTDDADTLQELPGVGPVLAKSIIAGRPYKSADDLAKVDGFGPAKIEQVRKYVRVDLPRPEPKPEPKAEAPKAKTPKAAAREKVAEKAREKTKESSKSETKVLAPGRKISLNKATLDELQELPGIGPVKSQAIIDNRPFENIEDVMKVRGIKDETFAKIKDHIVVD